MSQSKFTRSGQWVATGTNVMLYARGEFTGLRICKAQEILAHGTRIKKSEAEANASLIATAPDMYHLLEDLNHELVMDDMSAYGDAQLDVILKIKKVLAKARGES